MNPEKLDEKRKKIFFAVKVVKIIALFLIVICAIKFLVCGDSFKNESPISENTISFSGHGEVSAVPDIANVDFTISKDAKTVKDAQDAVAQIEKKSLDFLKTSNVADIDIKTTNASFNPKYEVQTMIPCTQYGCPPGDNVIVGYTASESITIKIRNIDSAGKIMQGLGSLGVSDLNGPNFTIDKEDTLKISARKLAIDDAKSKAEVLAKDLGIRLGKITSFSENGNNPVPMYAKDMMAGATIAPSAPVVIPAGENIISSDVTITYDIK